MARSRKTEVAVAIPKKDDEPDVLIASGVHLRGAPDHTKVKSGQRWQELAWMYYDLIGEYRYACDWVGSLLSKAILTVVRRSNGKAETVTEGPARGFLDALYDGPEGQSDMLREIGIHLTVAGECYVVGWTDESGEDQWSVVASIALTSRGSGDDTTWYVDGDKVESKGQIYVMLIRLPHPRKHKEANSPSKAVLSILGEIHALTQHVQAQVISRLAGAGILILPSEMDIPARPSDDEDAPQTVNVSTATEMMQRLQQAMETAIKNREDASAVVPIVITAPGEVIQHAMHMTFWTELDEKSVELRNEAIRRLGLGMDMPPEVVTGMADLNHWSAWAADESAIKAHTEPLLRRVTRAFTQGYLRPLLRGEGDASDGLAGIDPAEYSVGADDSQMRLRPNRSKEALELYDRGELNGVSLRRETGFDESDVMTDDQMKVWLLRRIADGSSTPEQVEAALSQLGVPLNSVRPDAPAEETREARPSPSLLEHPSQDPPDRDDAPLVAACDVLTLRALERAGNKLKNKVQKRPEGVMAAEHYLFVANTDTPSLDFLLDDAWAHVPGYAARFGLDAESLEEALDTYCRHLISERAPRDTTLLASYLALVKEAPNAALHPVG
jgi:hypothetical protein